MTQATTNSFDGIVALYNSITPLRGKRKDWDIRPLGKRDKWWERIIKVSDTKYVLSDGFFAWGYGGPEYREVDKTITQQAAPIVWERRADGDYITIRNNSENSQSIARYNFIHYNMPFGMRHVYGTDGKHFIQYSGEKYFLPKFVTEWIKEDRDTGERGYYVMQEDKYVEFKYVGDRFGTPLFECVSGPQTYTVPIVNRELTTHYNPKIREMWQWMKAVLPVFGDTLKDQKENSLSSLGIASMYYWKQAVKPEMVRMWLDDEEKFAEERLAFAVLATFSIVAYDGDWQRGIRFVEEKNSYSKFRKLVQKMGDMHKAKVVEVR